jgi:iron complex outermembrane recepter protein
LYHIESAYNFSKFKFINLLIGGSYRIFQLNSEGTLFSKNPENGQEYTIHELGAYLQAIKSVFKNKLHITTGLRYDKNLSFEGEFTPRFALVYSPDKFHNFRVSYQTAFRLPTSQDQYIDLSVPGQHNLGGIKSVIDKYDLNGKAITQLSYNTANPITYTYGKFEPEKIKTFEIGYKTLFKNSVLFDIAYYHATFLNKLSSINVVKIKEDKSTEVFNIVESFPDNSYQHGLAFSADFMLPEKFSFGLNYSKDVSNNTLFGSESFVVVSANGNILAEIPPRDRWNFSFGNRNILKTGISFKVTYRYQSPASNFTSIVNKNAKATANQPFIDELNIIDAQVSGKIPMLKSILKIGGTNLGGKVYRTTIGNPYIGSTFYVSLLFDELLN